MLAKRPTQADDSDTSKSCCVPLYHCIDEVLGLSEELTQGYCIVLVGEGKF